MKRIVVKNGLVDLIKLNIKDTTDEPESYVVDDNVAVYGGWVDNEDGTFSAPPPPSMFDGLTLNDAQSLAVETVAARHAERLNTLTGNSTTEERDTWAIQKEQAQLYLADPVGATDAADFLAGLLTPAEKTAADGASKPHAQAMAEIIMAKSTYTINLIRVCGEVKRAADDAIEAAADITELEAAMSAWEADEAAAIAAFLAS